MATAGFQPTVSETAPRMTAVRALHGVRTTSVQTMIRSRMLPRTRAPRMAGTLQPAPATSGIMARPCSPILCMTRSVRNATAFRYPLSSRTARIR